MSSENDEWSDCEWFDEVANNIILDIERRQLALEIQVETLSMHHVIIIFKTLTEMVSLKPKVRRYYENLNLEALCYSRLREEHDKVQNQLFYAITKNKLKL